MPMPSLEETVNNNSFLKFVSRCYLQIIFFIMFILFLIEFIYLFKKNPEDLVNGDFFAKYVNMTNKFLKQK